VSAVESSPFSVGLVTIARCFSPRTRSDSSTGMPASLSGFDASKTRFAASTSDSGAVATTTRRTSARRYRCGAARNV
jgi:hypothetical protein